MPDPRAAPSLRSPASRTPASGTPAPRARTGPSGPGARARRGGHPGRDHGRAPTLGFWVVGGISALLVACLAVAGVATWERFAVATSQADLQQRLRPAQAAASDLVRAYVDQETGQRGFVLTGRAVFLQPYDDGRARSQDLVVRLDALVGSDPEARRRLDAVRSAATTWQEQAARPAVDDRRRGPVPPARAVAAATRGKALFDQLRQRLADLSERVDQLTEDQVAAMHRIQDRANVVTALGCLVALLVAATTVWTLRRMTLQPLARLVGQLSAVTGGATQQRITVAGPRELRTISGAAETMRVALVGHAEALAAAQHELGAYDERERVAEHVGARTVQRIFGLSLSLSHLSASRPVLARHVAPLISETDAIAHELRTIIYPEHPEHPDVPAPEHAGPSPAGPAG